MSMQRLHEAADYLAALHSPCGERPVSMPPELAPADEAQAYELQRQVAARLGRTAGAWKVAMSSAEQGTYAPVFATDVHPSGVTFRSAITQKLGIEPEVAFTMKRALPAGPRYTRQQLIDAIGSAHAAIEVVISRFQQHETAAPLDRLADNISNGGLILGEPLEDWQHLDLPKLPLRMTIEHEHHEGLIHGSRGHPQGDPLIPLLWLVNAAHGPGLRIGDVVTTGSYAGLNYATPGKSVRAQFAGLGVVEVSS